ncbi:hypothetical protein LINPERPRIM_LOCUS17879 [Linum perenne]
MCRASHVLAEQISGPLFILQIWAWEQFPLLVHHQTQFRGTLRNSNTCRTGFGEYSREYFFP